MAKRRIVVVPGERFGELSVVCEDACITVSGLPRRMVKCVCTCGREMVVRLAYLRSGHTQSCGCRRSAVAAIEKRQHGGTGTRLHGIWNGMKNRCFNPNVKSYRYYGAKGVKIADEWLTFEPFRDWAQANGYEPQLTIDRIDPFGDYEPSNCRWISKSEQRHNRRDTVGVAK